MTAGLDPQDFRDHVIAPTLHRLRLWSAEAEELLLGTALAESGLRRLRQLGGGPALGVYQMEPATHADIWRWLRRRRPLLADDIAALTAETNLSGSLERAPHLVTNLAYATAMTRAHYLRVRMPIPRGPDAQARYWKRSYNTPLGAGTVDHYLAAWTAAQK